MTKYHYEALAPSSGQEIDLLSIESQPWKPHLETAGEICIARAREGQRVVFSFLRGLCEPVAPYRNIPFIQSPEYRLQKFERLIARNGVTTIPAPEVPIEIMATIRGFANESVDEISAIRKLTYKNAKLGLGVASSLIDVVSDPAVKLNGYRKVIRRLLFISAASFEKSLLLIEKMCPRRVLVFNGRFATSNAVCEAARALGVDVIFHERGADYSRYQIFERVPHDLCYNRDLVRANWAFASSDAKAEAATYFTRRRAGDGIGWVSFTDAQTAGLAPPRSSKRRIVYFSSSDDEIAAAEDCIEHPVFASQRDAIRFLVDWIEQQSTSELIIRVHPALREAAATVRNWWEGIRGNNVKVLPSDSPVDSYALAETADLVVTYASTMGLECSFMGKPSILLDDAIYRGFGCCHEPQSPDALLEMLEQPNLPALPKEACLPTAHFMLNHGTPHSIYSPRDLFSGTFFGDELTGLSPFAVRIMKTSQGGRILGRARSAIRYLSQVTRRNSQPQHARGPRTKLT